MAAGRAFAARGSVHQGRRAQARHALERRDAPPEQARRRRGKGFEQADVVIEREFRTKPVHQGYIEPQASIAQLHGWRRGRGLDQHAGPFRLPGPDRQAAGSWTSPRSSSSRRPSSAAASGARTTSISSRWRWRFRSKSRRPVKMVMTRDEVFRATGPDLRAPTRRVKIGCDQGRPHHRRPGRAQLPVGRLRRIVPAAGDHHRLHALRHRERAGGRATTSPATGPRSRPTGRRARR